MNATVFFFGEGLFFIGLSLGIIGSAHDESGRQSGWVLLAIGVVSLLVAALLSFSKKLRRGERELQGSLRPMSLALAFDSLLQSPQVSTLLSGDRFRTEISILLGDIKMDIPIGTTLILHHFEGLGVSVEVDSQQVELHPGEILRVSRSPQARVLRVGRLDYEEFGGSEPHGQRAARIVSYFIGETPPL